MNKHILTIREPAKATPSTKLSDGTITGNGDITAVYALGTCGDPTPPSCLC